MYAWSNLTRGGMFPAKCGGRQLSSPVPVLASASVCVCIRMSVSICVSSFAVFIRLCLYSHACLYLCIHYRAISVRVCICVVSMSFSLWLCMCQCVWVCTGTYISIRIWAEPHLPVRSHNTDVSRRGKSPVYAAGISPCLISSSNERTWNTYGRNSAAQINK